MSAAKRLRFKQVDTFTSVAYTGSPVAVVLGADRLDPAHSSDIAREFQTPDCVLCSDAPGSDSLGGMTVLSEKDPGGMSICAIVAATHVLMEEKAVPHEEHGTGQFTLESPSGPVPIWISGKLGHTAILTSAPVPILEKTSQYKTDLLRLLGISLSDFEPKFAIHRTSHLLVPIRRLHTLLALVPNLPLIANFLRTRQLAGMCVFTNETLDRNSAFHIRYISARGGASEEAVHATAHTEVASYLIGKGYLNSPEGICSIQSEQGDTLQRTSRVLTELRLSEEGKIIDVRVGGSAVTVFEGELIPSS